MTNTRELIDRLREADSLTCSLSEDKDLHGQAADALESAEAKLAKAVSTLEVIEYGGGPNTAIVRATLAEIRG